MIEYEKFNQDCLLKKCNRHTFTSKQCEKQFKIKQCYDKYIKQQEKNKTKQEQKILKQAEDWECKKQACINGEITKEQLFDSDIELLKVFKKVDERDKYQCVFWNNFLTVEQKTFIISNFYDEYKRLFRIIDHAHLESISGKPELKYDVNNIICLSRFFHSRLDQYRELLTNKPMTKQERQKYIGMFKDYVEGLK